MRRHTKFLKRQAKTKMHRDTKMKEPSLKEASPRKVAYAKELPLKKNEIPVCYFCGKQVTEDDYCYGCKHFVCDDCNVEPVLGKHDVDEHQKESEEVGV